MSLVSIWLTGMAVLTGLFALVWLGGNRRANWRGTAQLVLMVATWPIWAAALVAALVLVLIEFAREGRHDQFWNIP